MCKAMKEMWNLKSQGWTVFDGSWYDRPKSLKVVGLRNGERGVLEIIPSRYSSREKTSRPARTKDTAVRRKI